MLSISGKRRGRDDCKANEALREGSAKRFTGYIERLKQIRDSYGYPFQARIDLRAFWERYHCLCQR